jgi:hypothetical protein
LGIKGQDCLHTYEIKAGDTCDSIATAFGIDTSTLLANNRIIMDGCSNTYINEVIDFFLSLLNVYLISYAGALRRQSPYWLYEAKHFGLSIASEKHTNPGLNRTSLGGILWYHGVCFSVYFGVRFKTILRLPETTGSREPSMVREPPEPPFSKKTAIAS